MKAFLKTIDSNTEFKVSQIKENHHSRQSQLCREWMESHTQPRPYGVIVQSYCPNVYFASDKDGNCYFFDFSGQE